jgi:2-oxoglutarate ferredoxin oxidoreductase subunit beta
MRQAKKQPFERRVSFSVSSKSHRTQGANKMAKTYQRPAALSDRITHYCPGCTHGIAHRLVAEVIDELGIRDRTVGIAPVGCAVLAYEYFTFDFQESAHGRAPAMATGIKRVRPDLIVFTYQGDGDLASIGTAEIIHAANRGEKFTVIFINNAVYGMTGGQMAPTTLPNQRTTTSPAGRNVAEVGMPIRMAELLSSLKTPGYITRQTLIKPKYIIRAKKAIKKAFVYQLENRCFSFVELVSTCPTNWGMTPGDAVKWAEEHMLAYYQLGEFKIPEQGEAEGLEIKAQNN